MCSLGSGAEDSEKKPSDNGDFPRPRSLTQGSESSNERDHSSLSKDLVRCPTLGHDSESAQCHPNLPVTLA